MRRRSFLFVYFLKLDLTFIIFELSVSQVEVKMVMYVYIILILITSTPRFRFGVFLLNNPAFYDSYFCVVIFVMKTISDFYLMEVEQFCRIFIQIIILFRLAFTWILPFIRKCSGAGKKWNISSNCVLQCKIYCRSILRHFNFYNTT